MTSLLLRGLLLPGDRPLARTLPGPGVRVRALPANRQVASVPHSPITPDVHQPLDVHRNVAAQITFHLDVVGDNLADSYHLFLGKVLDARIGSHVRLLENEVRLRAADPEDVGQADFHPLVERKGGAGDWGHLRSSSSLEP